MAELYMLQKIVGKNKQLYLLGLRHTEKVKWAETFSKQTQSILHKKAIPLTLTPDPQGSPTKHFQMQSLRTKSCNSTKHHHELIIMVYPIQDTEFCK